MYCLKTYAEIFFYAESTKTITLPSCTYCSNTTYLANITLTAIHGYTSYAFLFQLFCQRKMLL